MDAEKGTQLQDQWDDALDQMVEGAKKLVKAFEQFADSVSSISLPSASQWNGYCCMCGGFGHRADSCRWNRVRLARVAA